MISCGWLEFLPGDYALRSDTAHCQQNGVQSQSRCQYEIDVMWQNVISHPVDTDETSKIAPIRILSFDIECTNRKGLYYENDFKSNIIKYKYYIINQIFRLQINTIYLSMSTLALHPIFLLLH